MDVSDAECVARAAAYYEGRSVQRRLRSGTCKIKTRVYAAETEVSVNIRKDSEKRVVPAIYTVIVVRLLVQTRAVLHPFSPDCVLVLEQKVSNQGSFMNSVKCPFLTTFYLLNILYMLLVL